MKTKTERLNAKIARLAPRLATLPPNPAKPMKGKYHARFEVPREWGTGEVWRAVPTCHRDELAGPYSGGWVGRGPRIVSPEAGKIILPVLKWLASMRAEGGAK